MFRAAAIAQEVAPWFHRRLALCCTSTVDTLDKIVVVPRQTFRHEAEARFVGDSERTKHCRLALILLLHARSEKT